MSEEEVSLAACEAGPGAGGGDGGGGGGNDDGLEPLACVTCRSRKLKCDRTKPACTRCSKLKAECQYPESRRKPAFKRRNVKELEERLAQVEVLLKDAAGKTGAAPEGSSGGQERPQQVEGRNASSSSPQRNGGQGASLPRPGFQGSINDSRQKFTDESLNWTFPSSDMPGLGENANTYTNVSPMGWGAPFTMPDMRYKPRKENAGATSYELLGLGLFEALPPTKMIEELHQTYFVKQHPLIPIVHPGRYMTAFYSAPHLRPPMALQYAIWTMATNGHEEYSGYHDVFHRRARHYLEEDELRGDGEHFLTVAHAQAWALMATNEARYMWFTRAAMSAARCIKLLQMMGLHKLDDPNTEQKMAPTLVPPKDWTELEERRRTFWGAFAIDSHASISTGWPTLIDPDEVTTHLPSSEEAFNHGREETTCRLQDVFSGSPYSSFAGAAVICHLFNRIMKHVHHSRPDDAAEDYEYGKYWNRHRELDNILSSAFMFLPERFRLPEHLRDPVAVHTNLNLHASVICLHNNAYEKANEHSLPDAIKMTIKTRLVTAAQEVVNIVKMTSHSNAGYRSPLVALALYVASSVCIIQAQEDQGLSPKVKADLEFLLMAMDAIGKQHLITLNFLRQVMVDLQRANLIHLLRVPDPGLYPMETVSGFSAPCGNNIPLFARSQVSKKTDILPPLPGRLPLNKPIGRKLGNIGQARRTFDAAAVPDMDTWQPGAQGSGNPNKRRRVNLSPEAQGPNDDMFRISQIASSTSADEASSSPDNNTPRDSSLSSASWCGNETAAAPPGLPGASFRLPHRTGSSTSGSSPAGVMMSNSHPTPASSGISPGTTTSRPTVGRTSSSIDGGIMLTDAVMNTEIFAGVGAGEGQARNAVDLNIFQGLDGWDGPQDAPGLYAQVAGAMLDDDSWMALNEAGNSSWDTGQAGEV